MKILLLLLLFSFNAYADHEVVDGELSAADLGIPAESVCDGHATDSSVQLIDSVSDFQTYRNSATIDVFCVAPGDYAFGAASSDDFTSVGTSGDRKYLIYYNQAVDTDVHPVDMTEGQRARMTGFWNDGAEYWTIHRITFDDTASFPVWIQSDADDANIILDRILIENSASDGAGALAIQNSGLHIQYSVIRDIGDATSGVDQHCSVVSNGVNDVTFIGNEIYNCSGDGTQVADGATGGSNRLFRGNEYYINDDQRTDGSGNFTPTGDHQCAENAVDFKTGGLISASHPYSTSETLIFDGNLMHGFSYPEDGNCLSNAGGDPGPTVVMHLSVEAIDFKNNVLLDGTYGITFANTTVSNVNIINNLFSNYKRSGDTGAAFTSINKVTEADVAYNTIIDSDAISVFGDWPSADFQCNVIIDTPDDGAITIAGDSNYSRTHTYNSDDATIGGNTGDVDTATAAASNNKDLVVTKFHITNPTEVTISLAQTSVTSPHDEGCSTPSLPADEADRGIDDTDPYTNNHAGFNINGFAANPAISLPPNSLENVQMGKKDTPEIVVHVHTFDCLVERFKEMVASL